MTMNIPITWRYSPVPAVLCVCCLAVTATRANAKTNDLAGYIPADAFFFNNYQRVGNPDEEPEFTNFSVSFEAWVDALDDILEWRIVREELTRAGVLSDGTADKPSIWEVLSGEEHAFAVFQPAISEGLGVPIVLHVARSKDPKSIESQLLESLENLRDLGLPVQTDSHYHEDVAVTSNFVADMQLPGVYIVTACVDDLFILSTSSGIVERAIDVMRFGDESLLTDAAYQRIVSQLPKDRDQLSFLNVKRIGFLLDEIAQQIITIQALQGDSGEQNPAAPILELVKSYLQSIEASGSAARWTGRKRESTSYVAFAEDAVKYPFGVLLEGEPSKLDSQSFVPRRTQSFVATNQFNLKLMWRTFTGVLDALAATVPDVGNVVAELEKHLSLSIEEDIISILGEEMMFVQSAASVEGIMPVKQQAVIIEVKDPDAAIEVVNRVVFGALKDDLSKSAMSRSVHRDVEMMTFRIPLPLIPYSPTIGVTDKYLIVATSDKYFKQLLDVQAGEADGLTRSTNYESVSDMYGRDVRTITYTDLSRGFLDAKASLETLQAFGGLSTMFGAGMGDQAGQDVQDVAMIMELVSEGVGRLATLMQMLTVLQAQGTCVAVKDGGLLTTDVIVYRDLPRQTHLDMRSRRSISFFAKDHLIEASREVRNELGAPFGDELALYLLGLVQRYIPERATDASSEIAKIKFDQGDVSAAFDAMQESLQGKKRNDTLYSAIKLIHEKGGNQAVHEFLGERGSQLEGVDLTYLLLRLAREGDASEASGWLNTAAENAPADTPWLRTARAEALVQQSQEPAEFPNVHGPLIGETPEIDGDLSDDFWKNAAAVEGLSLLAADGNPSRDTVVRIAAGPDALYVAFECTETEIEKLDAEESGDDKRIMGDDNIMLWISPDRMYRRFYQFGTNPGDGTLDARGTYETYEIGDAPGDRREYELRFWDPDWRRATARTDDGWTAEFAIPYKAIETERPASGDVWGLNLSRRVAAVAPPENLAWSAADDCEHPRSFGYAWFNGGGEN